MKIKRSGRALILFNTQGYVIAGIELCKDSATLYGKLEGEVTIYRIWRFMRISFTVINYK